MTRCRNCGAKLNGADVCNFSFQCFDYMHDRWRRVVRVFWRVKKDGLSVFESSYRDIASRKAVRERCTLHRVTVRRKAKP